MFELKTNITDSALVEFKYGKNYLRKSSDWLRKNQAEAIVKYRLEYLYEIPNDKVLKKFIQAVERRIYQVTDLRHPDNPGYELRHIRKFSGNLFSGIDISDIEKEISGAGARYS